MPENCCRGAALSSTVGPIPSLELPSHRLNLPPVRYCGAQVIREATTLGGGGGGGGDITGGAGSYSTTARGVEVQEALRCLVLLTSHRHRAIYRTLGMSASGSTPAGVEALLNLAAAEAGAALQVSMWYLTDPVKMVHIRIQRLKVW